MKAFRDYSDFQGWKQYVDESGQEWRVEDRGCGIYFFYKLVPHALGDSFHKVGHIRVNSKLSVRKLHEIFIEDSNQE